MSEVGRLLYEAARSTIDHLYRRAGAEPGDHLGYFLHETDRHAELFYRMFYTGPRRYEILTPDSVINFDDDNRNDNTNNMEVNSMSQFSEILDSLFSVSSPLLGRLINPDAEPMQPSERKIDVVTAILTAESILGAGKGKQKLQGVLRLVVPIVAARIGLSVADAQLLATALINLFVKKMNKSGELPKPAPDVPSEDEKYLPATVFEGQIPPDAEIIAKGPYVAGRDYVYVATSGVAWGVGQANHLPLDGFKPHHKLNAD